MLSPLKRRGGRFAAGGAATGILLASMLFAGTAEASPASPGPAQNNIIIGSGSSTTYYMMQALDTLYNDSQGCQIFDPTGANQELNLACESAVDGSTGDTFTTPENLTAPFGENPYNDVAVEEPYTGSSNGINMVADNAKNGYPFAFTNFARSSRAIKTSGGVITDAAGENFVAYAKDGVDWVTFSAVPNKKLSNPAKKIQPPSRCGLPTGKSAKYLDIELSNLQGIWDTTGTPISNWAQLCALALTPAGGTPNYKKYAAEDAPICVYTAQDGSGTLATWDGYLGGTATETTINELTPNQTAASWAASVGLSTKFVNAGCTNDPTSGSAAQYGASHQIFENETQQLIAQGASQTGTGQYSDTADAIFFYSFGRYQLQCVTGQSICQPKGFHVQIGQIENIFPTKKNIIADDCTPQPNCFPSPPNVAWPVPRYLYNVYGNGNTAGGVTPATPATVNYVSEIGFLCKPQTYTNSSGKVVPIVDPLTGVSYKSEIANAIQNFGFFRLPLQSDEVASSAFTHPGVDLLATGFNETPANKYSNTNDAYLVFDPTWNATLNASATTNAQDNYNDNLTAGQNTSALSGYCKVYTTDH